MYSVMYSVIHYKVIQFSRPKNFEIEKLKLSFQQVFKKVWKVLFCVLSLPEKLWYETLVNDPDEKFIKELDNRLEKTKNLSGQTADCVLILGDGSPLLLLLLFNKLTGYNKCYLSTKR